MSARKLRITLKRSLIGRPSDQRKTVQALGLRRINHTVERPDNPQVRGQVRQIQHMVHVEEIEAQDTAAPTTAGEGAGQ